MADLCDDGRFELIEKFKLMLMESTNISDSEDELKVLDTILFRFWQMGWLDKLEQPTAQQWIPCKTRLPEDLEEVNVTWVNHKPESYYEFAKDKPFTASAVYYKGDWYWYSSTCADILGEYGKNDIEKVDDAIEIVAWMPLPEPWRGES